MATDAARPESPRADPTVELALDGERIDADRGRRLIEVARAAGAYVPGWCHHPSMRPAAELEAADRVYRALEGPAAPRVGGGIPGSAPAEGEAVRGRGGPAAGCGICVVEVDGQPVRACEERARPGLEVRTDTPAVRERQRAAMAELFRHHPHACLDCPQKEGCDRNSCSMNVPLEGRCCDLLGSCELERSAEAVGLDWGRVPAYEPLDRPAQATPVMAVDWELCVGCLRCVGVCEDHVGAGVWRFTRERDADGGGEATVGLKAATLTKSGCKLCTACVEACPTGALTDAGGPPDDRLPVEFRRALDPVPLPRSLLPLERSVVEEEVPSAGGVYTLYDADGEVTAIRGVADLAAGLREEVGGGGAEAFAYELDESFTRRETELVQRHVRRHGEMPGAGGGGELDGLF